MQKKFLKRILLVFFQGPKKFLGFYFVMSTRLNGGSTKNDQKYTTDRVNNADFRNDLHFFVTSSRPIKAQPKGLKSATFGLQNLPEGGEIENNAQWGILSFIGLLRNCRELVHHVSKLSTESYSTCNPAIKFRAIN